MIKLTRQAKQTAHLKTQTPKNKQVNSAEVEAWLTKTRQGNDEAAESLHNFIQPVIKRIVFNRKPRRACPEDLSQEILVKVFTKLEQYSGKVPFVNWVSRIAVNFCTTEHHRDKLNREMRLADFPSDNHGLEDYLNRTDEVPKPTHLVILRETIKMIFESLSARDRLLVELICLKGHSHEEVESLTGWNISVTKTRLFRIRQRLIKNNRSNSRSQINGNLSFEFC